MSKTINKNPFIICVAITGSVPTKKNNPNIPISVNEQIESTQQAFEAGASIVHCHVRNDDGSVSSDPKKFKKLKVLGKGDVKEKLNIEVNYLSNSAKIKLEKSGSNIKILNK